MNFVYTLKEVLRQYEDDMYLTLELRIFITSSVGTFDIRSTPLKSWITDGTHTVEAFANILSGNQRELISYYTVDAFSLFSFPATIHFGYGDTDSIIENVNVSQVDALPPLYDTPYIIANNAWLTSAL